MLSIFGYFYVGWFVGIMLLVPTVLCETPPVVTCPSGFELLNGVCYESNNWLGNVVWWFTLILIILAVIVTVVMVVRICNSIVRTREFLIPHVVYQQLHNHLDPDNYDDDVTRGFQEAELSTPGVLDFAVNELYVVNGDLFGIERFVAGLLVQFVLRAGYCV